MKTIERITTYPFTPANVFHSLDNLGITGMHMTQSSIMMMGSKLDVKFLTDSHNGLGTQYRWIGKMMGMTMDFTVEVTKWTPGEEKIWETICHPKMIIYSWYRMHFLLTKIPDGTSATLSISYERPVGSFYNLLSVLFADWYCRWCLRNMLEDCRKEISKVSSDN